MDFLGMMTAGTYTFAAVNAELTGDPGLTVSNADCLGRTALDTVDAALAEALYLMCSFYHLPFSYKLADPNSHSDSGADTEFCLYLHVIGIFLHIR